MSHGMYSVIRYSNNFNDQRVNLGVVVWHPIDGFQCRFAPTLGRVHAVNARADLDELQDDLEEIRRTVIADPKGAGALLEHLSCRFKEGVEVTTPVPARLYSVSALADRLYGMLVTPKAEAPKPRMQTQFQEDCKTVLQQVARRTARNIQLNRHCNPAANGRQFYRGF